MPAVSGGGHVHVCVCVCVHSEMENCYSVFKWSLSIHFHHKSNNSEFLSPCRPLAIHWLSFLSLSLNFFPAPPLCFSPFHHFLSALSFCVSSGINQACSCVAWLHYIIMKFSLRCSKGNRLAREWPCPRTLLSETSFAQWATEKIIPEENFLFNWLFLIWVILSKI